MKIFVTSSCVTLSMHTIHIQYFDVWHTLHAATPINTTADEVNSQGERYLVFYIYIYVYLSTSVVIQC